MWAWNVDGKGVAVNFRFVPYAAFAGIAGNYVSLAEALIVAEPHPLPPPIRDAKQEEDLSDKKPPVKVFIGILSTCTTELSHERRQQIRETWKGYTLGRFKNVDIKFILSQPSNGNILHHVEEHIVCSGLLYNLHCICYWQVS